MALVGERRLPASPHCRRHALPPCAPAVLRQEEAEPSSAASSRSCGRAPTVAATLCLRALPGGRRAELRIEPPCAAILRVEDCVELEDEIHERTRTRRARGRGRVVGERPLPAAKLCLRTLPGGGQAELRIELKVELRVEPPCAAVLRVEDCVELEVEDEPPPCFELSSCSTSPPCFAPPLCSASWTSSALRREFHVGENGGK